MPIPRVEHLGMGHVDWCDEQPAQSVVALSLTTGWSRVDGENDIRTACYVHDGTLNDAEAVSLADVVQMTPGFTLRVDVGHAYLGAVVLRSWVELSDDVPLPEADCANLEIVGVGGYRLTIRCASSALPLFQRIADRMLRPIAERTLHGVIKALSGVKLEG